MTPPPSLHQLLHAKLFGPDLYNTEVSASAANIWRHYDIC